MSEYVKQPVSSDEDGLQVVCEFLAAMLAAEERPRMRKLYATVLERVARPVAAGALPPGWADWIYRRGTAYWQGKWDEVSYGPYEKWTMNNVANGYRKIVAVYEWRFGEGEWDKALGRRAP